MQTEQASEYNSDKNRIINAVMGLLATVIIALLFSINSHLGSLDKFVAATEQKINNLESKNIEQDKRLDLHQSVIFLKKGMLNE